MGMSVNSPGVAVATQAPSSLQQTERQSSGLRINSAADDAAGMSISSRMSADLAASSAASRNIVNATSFSQALDGSLNQTEDMLMRVRELAVQAGNGIYSDSDRAAIGSEMNALFDELNNLTSSSEFNGRKYLDSNSSSTFQVGPDAGDQITLETASLTEEFTAGGLYDVDLSSPEAAQSALQTIDDALATVSGMRTEQGAIQGRLSAAADQLSSDATNTAQALSRIQDADMAAEASDAAKQDVLSQAKIAVQGQGNASAQQVLALLG